MQVYHITLFDTVSSVSDWSLNAPSSFLVFTVTLQMFIVVPCAIRDCDGMLIAAEFNQTGLLAKLH